MSFVIVLMYSKPYNFTAEEGFLFLFFVEVNVAAYKGLSCFVANTPIATFVNMTFNFDEKGLSLN